MKSKDSDLALEVLFLGTGTSDGVPLIGCDCAVCTGEDPRDSRLRSSVLVTATRTGRSRRILIDSSIDLRQQLLSLSRSDFNRDKGIDAVVYTHGHSDHLLGLAEVRPLTWGGPLKLIADPLTAADIRKRFDYFFSAPAQKGGGIPSVELVEHWGTAFDLGSRGDEVLTLIPVPVFHGKLPIFGWRIGNFAYISDASEIPESSYKLLEGVELLVINALRRKPHQTHFNLEQAVEAAGRIAAGQTFLTHICHSLSHGDAEAGTPASVSPAFDGLKVKLENGYVTIG